MPTIEALYLPYIEAHPPLHLMVQAYLDIKPAAFPGRSRPTLVPSPADHDAGMMDLMTAPGIAVRRAPSRFPKPTFDFDELMKVRPN